MRQVAILLALLLLLTSCEKLTDMYAVDFEEIKGTELHLQITNSAAHIIVDGETFNVESTGKNNVFVYRFKNIRRLSIFKTGIGKITASIHDYNTGIMHDIGEVNDYRSWTNPH